MPPLLYAFLLLLSAGAAPALAEEGPAEVALYVWATGLWDKPYPDEARRKLLRRQARRVAASGANTLILSFLHLRQDGTVVYNDAPLLYANGTFNPGFAHLPTSFKLMRSRGAQLFWSLGGWGNEGDWRYLDNAARAQIWEVLTWSGVQGFDLDPEPQTEPLSNFKQNIIDTIKWAAGKGLIVTSAPFTEPETWAEILEGTVDPATGRQLMSHMFVQLYGDFRAMEALKDAFAGRSIGVPRRALPGFLWPGWSPCLNFEQAAYPPDECGNLAGKAQPALIQMAAASLAASPFKSKSAFFWEWGQLEGQPNRNKDACNQTALAYTQAARLGLAAPAPSRRAATMCATLPLRTGRRFKLQALPSDGGEPVGCGAGVGSPLLCGALGQAPTMLRAYSLSTWAKGGTARLSMGQPMILATARKGQPGCAFLAYNEVQQLLYLAADGTQGVQPAELQLARATGAQPPVTIYPPTDDTRGPLLLRYSEAERQCYGVAAGVTCPPDEGDPSSAADAGSDDFTHVQLELA